MAASRPTRADESHLAEANSNILSLETALSAFLFDVGRLPTKDEGLQALVVRPTGINTWRGPYIAKLPQDPWGHSYVYRIPAVQATRDYDLVSFGPDGKPRTADDLHN